MGLVCPLSHFGGELLWFGLDLTGVITAALLSSLGTWGWLALLWLASTWAGRWTGRLLRATAAIGVFIIVADAVVLMVFSLRFNLRDAVAFGGDANVWESFVSLATDNLTGKLTLAAILTFWFLAAAPGFVWLPPWRLSARSLGIGLAAALIAIGLGLLPTKRGPVRRFAVASIWELMVCDTSTRPFSDPFKARVAQQIGAGLSKVIVETPPVEPRRPDILLLLVESWSSYHSRLFGGQRDWTPELDNAADRGIAFTNSLANGFTTEDGLIAVLTGEEPIMPARAQGGVLVQCFAGFHGTDRGLPHLLRPAGYTSYFFTNGPLEFSHKDSFLDSIGFDYLNDIRDAFYQDRPGGSPWPQGLFGAADEALYARVRASITQIQELRESGRQLQPFLMVIETTSSHLPLVCPIGPPHTEERVMRYTDHAAGEFIRGLETDGFFKAGGLLVAVSDHRAMLPLKPDEFAAFGRSAPWRVPLFLLAEWLPRNARDGRRATQTDIGPTLEWLTKGATAVAGRRGILLLPEPMESRFVGARVASHRSAVMAWDTRTGAEGTIRWNGDRSSASPGLEEALLWLTWERISREDRLALVPARDAPLRHARWLDGGGGTSPPPH